MARHNAATQRVLALFDVDPHTESKDVFGPDSIALINTDVDEPGDLREWLRDKLEDQAKLLEWRATRSGEPTRPLDGVSVTVSSDADVVSFIGDCDRAHSLFIVERKSTACEQLSGWPQARLVADIVIDVDGANPSLVGSSSRWEPLLLGLASQWIAAQNT